jgi:hypothetical protein
LIQILRVAGYRQDHERDRKLVNPALWELPKFCVQNRRSEKWKCFNPIDVRTQGARRQSLLRSAICSDLSCFGRGPVELS